MWIRYLLGTMLAFGAINSFAGGYYGLSGAPGVPLEWLADSPFMDYFIPGLILLVVVGGAFSFAAVASSRVRALGGSVRSQPGSSYSSGSLCSS